MRQRELILIVEDEDVYRSYLKELLNSKGFDVLELDCGDAVPDVVFERMPDLVVLDLFIHGMDGATVTRILKADERSEPIPIIILTSSVDHADLIECLEAGADDFINKHCKGYELFLRINAHLRAKRLYDKLKEQKDRLDHMLDITKLAVSSLDFKALLDKMVRRLHKFFKLDRCSLVRMLPDNPETGLVLASSDDHDLFELPVDMNNYPELREVNRTKEILVIPDIRQSDLLQPVLHKLNHVKWNSMMIVPLVSGEVFLGALFLRAGRNPAGFSSEEVQICEGIADTIASFLKNYVYYESLVRKKQDLEKAYAQKYQEQQDTNVKLEEALRLKDDFMAICSHDLKSPINVLIGHTNLLVSGKIGEVSDLQLKSLKAIRRQGERITKLVDDLLELRKIEEEEVQINCTQGDAARFVLECCQYAEGSVQDRGVRIEFEESRSEASGLFCTDYVLLRELLSNLLHNAVKFSPPEGVVRVKFSQANPDWSEIWVRDEGIGISPDEIPHIFEKFYTTKRPGIPRGSGLGLALAKRIVELLGGVIEVDSEPGRGSTFRVVVPQASADLVTAPGEVQQGVERSSILIVDDEKDAVELLGMMLSSRFDVHLATDGMTALMKARNLHPDLILMDVHMPRISGIETTRKLKASPLTWDIPVVMISSNTSTENKVQCFDAGADDFVAKPVEPGELVARIAVHLRARKERSISINARLASH